MGRHHTEIRQFRIFALVLGEEIFIGKTTSPRISAVYSRHRCGTVAATRGSLDQEERPSLHILEQLECTGADAYRHVLAWIHLFEQAGFCSINHVATAVSSDLLYPPTETILKALPQEPAQQILARTYVQKPSEANIHPSRRLAFLPEPEKQVQMNLRMTVKDKKTFDRFCRKHRLKSREALGLLLDQITGEDAHLKQLLSAQKDLREENNKLKDQLAVLSGKEPPVQEKNLPFRKSGAKRIFAFCSRDWKHIFSASSRTRKKICFLPFPINASGSKPVSAMNIRRRKDFFC